MVALLAAWSAMEETSLYGALEEKSAEAAKGASRALESGLQAAGKATADAGAKAGAMAMEAGDGVKQLATGKKASEAA